LRTCPPLGSAAAAASGSARLLLDRFQSGDEGAACSLQLLTRSGWLPGSREPGSLLPLPTAATFRKSSHALFKVYVTLEKIPPGRPYLEGGVTFIAFFSGKNALFFN
jgi:hypothetical protein